MIQDQPFADEAKERRYQESKLIFALTGQTLERSAFEAIEQQAHMSRRYGAENL